MKIKKFVASTMTEAMNLIKKEFGEDAIILNTRNIKSDNPKQKNILEVTAAIDKKEPVTNENTLFNKKLSDASKKAEPTKISSFQFNVLKKEIDYISERMDLILNHVKYENLPHIPKILQEKSKFLIHNEVTPSIANEIIETVFTNLKGEELLDEELIENKISMKLKGYLKVSGPIKFNKNTPTVVILIGPTGVGKSTTIAKMAASYKYKYSKKVALISVDSFRIAAMDQLKSFAEIAGIKFEAAYNNTDLVEKINGMMNYDLILIDTAGLNPKEMKKMVNLKELIKVARADEIHLLLSATTKESDLKEIIKNYSVIPYDYLIYTKMDETSTFGFILNIANEIDKPISYITNGQSIPDDFILADRTELSKTILRGKYGIL